MIRVDVALRLGAFDLDVAFENDAGITALFGRSGSGKSMTINLIAGLKRPDAVVVLDGRCWWTPKLAFSCPPIGAGWGCVPGCSAFPHLSVRQISCSGVGERSAAAFRLPGGRDAGDRAPARAQAGAPLRGEKRVAKAGAAASPEIR
jgi:molybdate transport system ATP-binding protein